MLVYYLGSGELEFLMTTIEAELANMDAHPANEPPGRRPSKTQKRTSQGVGRGEEN